MLLHEMAHARSGDKGDISDISVIAYNAMNFPLLLELVTADRVQQHFSGFVAGNVRRYELPQLHALKFVLDGALDGGVTRSLNLDIHGKCLSSLLLGMELGEIREPSGPRSSNDQRR